MNISQSEVDSFNACERKHVYAHIEKLASPNPSVGIKRGNTGHAFMEAFLRAKKDNLSDSEAFLSGSKEAMEVDQEMFVGIVDKLKKWLTNVWPTLGWTVLEVEQEYRLPVGTTKAGTELIFPFRIDALVKIGPDLVIVDHKFVADFYDQELIDVIGQMPKYIGAMRALGFPVKYAQYNMVRTRKIVDETLMFSQPKIRPTDIKIQKIFANQVSAMQNIGRRKEQSVEWNLEKSRTASTPYVCKGCPFIVPCAMELDGRDTRIIKKVNYIHNTYGYEEL